MLYVINADWGGFSVPEEVCEAIGCDRYAWEYEGDIRTNEVLIEWVRTHESDLALVDIPEEATDWELNEYDGLESITAVVDGKLVHLYELEED